MQPDACKENSPRSRMRGGRQAGDSSVTCRRAARLLPPLPAAIGETCARKTALRGSFLRFEVVMLSALFAMALPAFSFAWSQLWSVASRFRGRSSGQAKRPLNVKTCQRRRFFVRGCASGGPPAHPAQARAPSTARHRSRPRHNPPAQPGRAAAMRLFDRSSHAERAKGHKWQTAPSTPPR